MDLVPRRSIGIENRNIRGGRGKRGKRNTKTVYFFHTPKTVNFFSNVTYVFSYTTNETLNQVLPVLATEMPVIQLAKHVFMLDERVILAAGNTPFIHYCQIAEKIQQNAETIVHEHVIPTHDARHEYDDYDDDVFSEDDEFKAPFTSIVDTLSFLFTGKKNDGDSSGKELHEMASREDDALGSDRDDDQDQGMATGASVDTTRVLDPEDGHMRRRRESHAPMSGTTTMSEAGPAPRAAAAAAANRQSKHRINIMNPVTSGQTGKEEEDEEDDDAVLQWYSVEKVYMWFAFEAYNATCAIDNSIVTAVRSGKLDLSPGSDLQARLDKEVSMRLEKVTRYDRACQNLIDTIETSAQTRKEDIWERIQECAAEAAESRRALLPTLPSQESCLSDGER